MKERMVLDLKGNKARREIVKIQEYTRNGNFDCIVFKEVSQVPETWEELKELCKGITVDVTVCKDGTVYCYEHCIAKNRTPAQMWQIIKNLIGEE